MTVIALWLPIIVAAVAVFIASFLAWVVLPHHKADYRMLRDGDAFLDMVRGMKLEPGAYMFPPCDDPKLLKDPDFRAKYDAGPHGMLSVWGGAPAMAKNLVLTFIFYMVVSVLTAYVATAAALTADSDFAAVFRLTGTVAVMAYTLGVIPNAIWFGRTLRALTMEVIDGVAFGLITGAVFASLW